MARVAAYSLFPFALLLAWYAGLPGKQEPRVKTSAPPQQAAPAAPQRVNELKLAHLRPGISRLADAEKLYPARFRLRADAETQPVWADNCGKQLLLLELNEANVITSVIVTGVSDKAISDCESSPMLPGTKEALASKLWITGRGLKLGDPLKRVLSLYGPPASRAPSTQAGLDLELLYYEFDWAGPDVPQVMEISCDRKTGRVVQMTLSFPSL